MHSLPHPKQLVELNIDVQSRYYDLPLELSHFDGLEALDAALQPELFKELQAVNFHVTYDTNERSNLEEGLTEHIRAVIKNKLPKLFVRNIIEVSVHRS